MTTLKANTKRAAEFWCTFNHSYAYTLAQVYGRFSAGKAAAERRCREMMIRENGEGFAIMGKNTFGFTCGWVLPDGSLRVETRDNSYLVLA